ncbi:transcriptional coactivator/pterin dehydratase [Amylocarpus encephaloides]|uniref:4a-hydroxytetrahydrobiopterin dehydratase n=1 Tax=Amylocarpus encephaloides TaxID=45428 RepID=A0A9P7YDJ3_9HELO|nr:transcriptional coactivator/pterin dehydratase [Amylocarpus encephaloides]
MAAAQPVFSSNYTAEEGAKEFTSLLKSEGQGGRWTLIESGKGIERRFRFKGFKKCWGFMGTVAQECIVQKHHPEWSNVYNTTFMRWTTHSPPGLSAKDVLMARFCDEAAATFGEVYEEGSEEEGGLGKDLVDRVGVEAGDCCVPKEKR